jgi:hypothetical protein
MSDPYWESASVKPVAHTPQAECLLNRVGVTGGVFTKGDKNRAIFAATARRREDEQVSTEQENSTWVLEVLKLGSGQAALMLEMRPPPTPPEKEVGALSPRLIPAWDGTTQVLVFSTAEDARELAQALVELADELGPEIYPRTPAGRASLAQVLETEIGTHPFEDEFEDEEEETE